MIWVPSHRITVSTGSDKCQQRESKRSIESPEYIAYEEVCHEADELYLFSIFLDLIVLDFFSVALWGGYCVSYSPFFEGMPPSWKCFSPLSYDFMIFADSSTVVYHILNHVEKQAKNITWKSSTARGKNKTWQITGKERKMHVEGQDTFNIITKNAQH